ncbi:histidine phosphatase family protein [Thermogemmatispora sp.]|uniref:histidine phosphatase family protein n=1 Tax=Thermogemmatispora sp. TaxID=1968838 RepID=UPI0035E3FACA
MSRSFRCRCLDHVRWRLGWNRLPAWLQLLTLFIAARYRLFRWRRRLLLLWRQDQSMGSAATTTDSMEKKQTLLFVRHGQTSWNVEHRLPGRLPGIPLTDQGRQQVARLADALSVLPISAIISSPLERARDTAEILAQGRGLEVWLEPDLMDTDVGHWAGERYDELLKKDPAWRAFVHDPTVAPAPDIESFPQVQQRVVAAVERWRQRPEAGRWPLFVAHADVIKLLLAHYSGLPPARAPLLAIDNASVSIVELEGELPPRLVAIGWTPRPGWLRAPEAHPPAASSLSPSAPATALPAGGSQPGETGTIEGGEA